MAFKAPGARIRMAGSGSGCRGCGATHIAYDTVYGEGSALYADIAPLTDMEKLCPVCFAETHCSGCGSAEGELKPPGPAAGYLLCRKCRDEGILL